jgi:manganese transport protein
MNPSPVAPTGSEPLDASWTQERSAPSMPEVHRSVSVRRGGSWLRRLMSFLGPGFLVAVGYVDPGNWATGLAGGSAFGYGLLWVIMLSNLMAMLLQSLAARLGIATGRDLAQACRDHYARPVAVALWLLCELAICATDLAEVIGTAIALNLLFDIPLSLGICITALDVLLVLWLQQRNFRYLEALTVSLVLLILICFAINVALSHPNLADVARGLLPSGEVMRNPNMLYIAIGIIGATVMPHNLYLHSSVVQTRRFELSHEGRRQAIQFSVLDVVAALTIALFINAGILILSAAAFHETGRHDVAEIQDAYRLLSPVLGVSGASLLFGIALLASGKSSTITATLTGQIVMEGFLSLRMPPWLRRLVTRALAIVPALLVVLYYGETGVARLLIVSQAVLSLQLPFAIVPLIRFTSDSRKMGAFVNPRWMTVAGCAIAVIIVVLNLTVLAQTLL